MLKIKKLVFCSILVLLSFNFFSCKKEKHGRQERIVIWTDSSDFAPYIEYFNRNHSQKAVLVYKENPAGSLPPAQDETPPDLVIGSWLINEHTKKFFEPVDYLFERKYLSSQDFYKILLDSGKFSNRQYLLPVSFNLPAIIFAGTNENLIEDNYTISLKQLKRAGEAYNKKNTKGAYTRMGFAPESSDDFLYLVAKIQGADFKEARGNTFTWNSTALLETIHFLNDWITEANSSSQTETDFIYKYLSVTDDKRVTQGRTLFAYTTSDRLFRFSKETLAKLDYRWIQYQNQLPVEDSMLMMGIPKEARNHNGAALFISWFYQSQTQQELLERKFSMHLDTNKFGIADGFSSIKEVNDRILPVYYTRVLSNIPQADKFKVYEKKPLRWEATKHKIIIPFIKDTLASDGSKKVLTIEERYTDWKKQGFN